MQIFIGVFMASVFSLLASIQIDKYGKNEKVDMDYFKQAERVYGIEADLLRSIALVETQCGKLLKHRGSDVGLMGITHYWYKTKSQARNKKWSIFKAAEILRYYQGLLGSLDASIRAYNVGPRGVQCGRGYKYLNKVKKQLEAVRTGHRSCQ